MSDINLGFVRTGIGLDLAPLKRDIAALRVLTRQMAEEQVQQTKLMQEQLEQERQRGTQRETNNERRRAERLLREERRLTEQLEREERRRQSLLLKEQEKAVKAQEAQRKKQFAALGSVGKQVGTAAGVGGIAIAAGLGDAAKTAAEFDQSMRNVDSIAHLTEAELKSLRGELLHLAKDPSIRQVPHDLAEGLYQVYSAGKSGKEGMEILEWGAKGASAGMTDTATSTKVLLATLNSGIKGVNSAREAMDVLFQEVNLGVNTFPELANSIGNILPTAKTVGVSLQEVSAAIAQMTRNGISADEAVTSLNQLMLHIWSPGREAEKLMTSLGISFGSAALEAKGLGGWLQDTMQKTHGNRDQLKHLVPEVRGAKGEFSLLSDGLKGYNELLKGMMTASEGAGQTTEALTRQNKGAVAQYELLKKEVDLTKIAIGDALLPTVNDAIKTFRKWLEEWNKQPEAAKNAQTGMALFAAEAGVAVGAVTTLVGWLAKLKTSLATLGIGASSTIGLGAIGLGAVAIGKTGLDAADWENRASKAQEDAAKLPTTLWYNKAREWQKKLELNEASKKLGMPRGSNFLSNGYLYHRMTEDEEMTAKVEAARLMKRQKEELAQWRKSQGLPTAPPEIKPPPKPDNPWGKGGYDRPKGKGKGGNAHEQAIKDAIRETQDENKLLEELIGERKKLQATGLDLQRLEAQADFNKTMESLGKSNSPTARKARGEAALLFQEQIRKAEQAENLAAMKKSVEGYRSEIAVPEPTNPLWFNGGRAVGNLGGEGDEASPTEWQASQKEKVFKAIGLALDYEHRRTEATKQATEEQKRLEYDLMQYRKEMGFISLKDYMSYLSQRMAEIRKADTSFGTGNPSENPEYQKVSLEQNRIFDEWLRTQVQLGKKGAEEVGNGIRSGQDFVKRAMEDMGGGALGAMQKALKKGLGGTFGDILSHTLTDLLSGVLENAITSLFKKHKGGKKGALNSIFGGGGLLGSALSPLSSLLNFDVGSNDRMARHYGADFMNMFHLGMMDFRVPESRVTPKTGGAGSVATVNIHLGTTHIHNDADVSTLANRIAYEVKQGLYGTH